MSDEPVVLYVEDDPQSRTVMRILLERRMGLQAVTILENSQNFREVVSALHPKPTIVFLDIQVEPHNGFQMLEILRQLDWARHVPIVALTASVMNEEIQHLKTASFHGVLSKPINLRKFPDLFNRILARELVWYITA